MAIVLIIIISVLSIQIKKAGKIYEADLITPKLITVDHSLDKPTINKMILASRLFYTFWNTGEYKYLDAAVAPTFIEHIFQKDNPLGDRDLKISSNDLRSAIPDLRCSIEDLLISGDKVTARLQFTGTSKGRFMGHPATGKPIKFIAIDVLRVQNGKIVEDWHVEDSLSLLEQLGVVSLKS